MVVERGEGGVVAIAQTDQTDLRVVALFTFINLEGEEGREWRRQQNEEL